MEGKNERDFSPLRAGRIPAAGRILPHVKRGHGYRWWSAEVPFALLVMAACSNTASVTEPSASLDGTMSAGGTASDMPMGGSGGSGGDMMMSSGGTGGSGAMGGSNIIDPTKDQTDPKANCKPTTCKEQGIGCGKVVDACGNVIDCADEGLTCGPLEVCSGSADMPAQCKTNSDTPCELCAAVPDCSNASQATKLSGRVVTAGQTDANVKNQLGVPNAFVYILRNSGVGDLPAITAGIPDGGTSCDRCQDQDLGPVLVGTVTDATGAFTLEGNVPVGQEFTLVVKAGRFRRATTFTLPAGAACQTTSLPTKLPDNPTRLPRNMMDGLAVNIPRMAVSTGEVDAMECVLEKMGIADNVFGNPGGADTQRVDIYRGGSTGKSGASIDTSTPAESQLYGDGKTLNSYDIVLADCEGGSYDSSGAQRTADGANVIDYVNRGGRFFASHLRFTWLDGNGTQAYDPNNPLTTGLAAAATWNETTDISSSSGNGVVAVGRPLASPHIDSFATWMMNEGVTTNNAFQIIQPRSQARQLGASSEEFVYTDSVVGGTTTRPPGGFGAGGMTGAAGRGGVAGSPSTGAGGMTAMGTPEDRTQQFSFNTPYAAPTEAVCGRVAYSGFHVAVGDATGTNTMPFVDAVFPKHCGSPSDSTGDLTPQEKVLLYMLFDLSACVGVPPPPPACTAATCDSLMLKCGFSGDGCGGVLDCGACPLPVPK
jgi:hypothetical protein